MSIREFSIGEAASESGVKVPTIRYYEDIGLLPNVARAENGRRFFDENSLKRLSFIRHARELGFDVDAIRTLLDLQDNLDQSCEAADAIARERLMDVDRRIARLMLLRGELQKMVQECSCGRVGECRVIEILADESHTHGRLTEG